MNMKNRLHKMHVQLFCTLLLFAMQFELVCILPSKFFFCPQTKMKYFTILVCINNKSRVKNNCTLHTALKIKLNLFTSLAKYRTF